MNVNYNLPDDFNEERFIAELTAFLEVSKQLFVQSFKGENHSWIIQAKEEKVWKKLIALDKAVTIRLVIENKVLKVMIGDEKWIDKAAGVAVGLWIAWPLLVTSAIGAIQQQQLPEEINKFIFEFINGKTVNNFNSCPITCPMCGSMISTDASFCSKCGAKLK